MRFLDNVLSDFIDAAPEGMEHAAYAALRERSVGLGVMGFHSFLQARGIPFESALAKSWNLKIFRKIRRGRRRGLGRARRRTRRLPGCRRTRHARRVSATSSPSRRPRRSASFAAAPARASNRSPPTSIPTRRCPAPSRCAIRICRKFSRKRCRYAGDLAIDPRTGRLGSASRHAEPTMRKPSFAPPSRSISAGSSTWPPIARPFSARASPSTFICPATSEKWDLHMLHWTAWARGLKSLYYCRSKSVRRAAFAGSFTGAGDYSECLACQ